MPQQQTSGVKTRFAPSPTGHLHVGGARTALFSFLVARQSGGTFLLRIEDTDRARHVEDAVGKIVEDLRWLGLDWDEGVEVGGENGPYRQSERLEIYQPYVKRLLQEKKAYYAFDTADELDAMREQARADKRTFQYPRPERFPTDNDAERARAGGRPVVVRFVCPREPVTVHDDAFGPVTMPPEEMDDFIIRKGDGWPTYHLANVIDDALMGVTHVMRGQEFLGQTWRQASLRASMGLPEPRYCHLPLITDMAGRKLSKRDGAVEVFEFRRNGYLPEALLNFLVLLGWRPGGNREKLTLDEMIEMFSVERIGKSDARFDRDKLLAFNTDAAAEASEQRLAEGLKDYLSLNDSPIPADDDELLRLLVRANRGFRTFADIEAKCHALFVADDAYEYDEKAVKKVLRKGDGSGYRVLEDLRGRLAENDWTAERLESLIRGYCEENELGMGKVAQPLRVAVTGSTVSPSIFETLLILGRERTLARIDRCLRETKEA